MKLYPAMDVHADSSDLLLAIVDDFGPTAVEERAPQIRIFFSTADERDQALRALAPRFEASAVDVPDEDWARRSQDTLTAITVGRVTIAPPWAVGVTPPPVPGGPVTIVILPSMGFGTGHHVTTRLCLAAMQAIDLTGRVVLDVGTGSGVLAIAADRLGASRALGIDHDPDAIQSARESLALNPDARHVTFETIELTARPLPAADVVTANLTGAVLVRSAAALIAAVPAGGLLILSGIQSQERNEVRDAFSQASVQWEREEDGWVGLTVKKS
jgi:ribosomal protein L11 methyltransferase